MPTAVGRSQTISYSAGTYLPEYKSPYDSVEACISE